MAFDLGSGPQIGLTKAWRCDCSVSSEEAVGISDFFWFSYEQWAQIEPLLLT